MLGFPLKPGQARNRYQSEMIGQWAAGIETIFRTRSPEGGTRTSARAARLPATRLKIGAFMADERFWMYDWLDDRGILTPEDVSRVLNRERGMRSLFTAASTASTDLRPVDSSDAVIAAGRSMDLTGVLECQHWECLTQKVDGLFKNAWHYFDKIVVEGPSALRVQRMLDNSNHIDRYRPRMINYATALVHLRQQGLDRYLLFREKPQECTSHFEEHLREANLEWTLTEKDEFIADLAARGTIDGGPSRCGDHWHFDLRHPWFRVPISAVVSRADSYFPNLNWNGQGDPMPAVAMGAYYRILAHLAADVRGAKNLEVPLALGFEVEENLLEKRSSVPATVDDVAVRLQLPVMQNLGAADILRFREDNDLDFERFRFALRSAIQTRLTSSADPDLVASEVYREVLEPELALIEAKLMRAQKSLTLKSALQMGVGTVTTSVGLMTAAPPLIAAGLAVIGASPMHAAKFIDDSKEVKLSDMYFLWHAEKHAHTVGRKSAGRRAGATRRNVTRRGSRRR